MVASKSVHFSGSGSVPSATPKAKSDPLKAVGGYVGLGAILVGAVIVALAIAFAAKWTRAAGRKKENVNAYVNPSSFSLAHVIRADNELQMAHDFTE